MSRLIVDTGPIVALLNGRDEHHGWARDALDAAKPPLATCEAVISEACFLLRRVPGGPDACLELLARGVLESTFRLAPEIQVVRRLMSRYADVPMSLADGCLVRMSEIDPKASILTIDGAFRIYRKHGRKVIPTLSP
ncbi:MAG: PIN domain-containing protein [Deltaproteobacteria bacterium]|nr:PIN domain-containing protein [Deltaproteobacteria bacterium]